MRFTVIWAIIVCSFGTGFQTGYSIGVMNAPEKVISDWIVSLDSSYNKELTLIWSGMVAAFCLGGVFGGMMCGVMSVYLGRKGGMLVANVFIFASCILIGLSKVLGVMYFLIVSRFLVGVYCGAGGGLAPMYLTEISPIKIRGAIGSCYQLMLTIGILVSQILGLYKFMGTDKLWPYLLGVACVPAIYQVVAFLFTPESPKYYLERDKGEKASNALISLYGQDSYKPAEEEMTREIAAVKAQPKVQIGDLFKTKSLRTPLIIVCLLMMAQQFSGINAVMFYSTHIFMSAKLTNEEAQMATIGVGVVNVLTTIVSLWLIEKFGRKCLLLLGFGGMLITTLLLFFIMFYVDSYSFAGLLAAVCVYLFIVFFAAGAGAIPWILGPELFSIQARPAALSIAVPTNWLSSLAIAMGFRPIEQIIGSYVFLIFVGCQVLSFAFIWFRVPETKNRPIEEIIASFE